MPSAADFVTAKKAMSKRYLAKAARSAVRTFAAMAPMAPTQNVVGVGVGTKFTDGMETKTKCVRFYVAEKVHKAALTSKTLLPASIDGIPTDVIVTGRFALRSTASDNKLRRRPIRPGTSVGFKIPPPNDTFVMAGTFGAVVTKGGKRFILSNNHVLAENGAVALGAAIFQPGLLDGGNSATDQVATLSKFVRIRSTGVNRVDCALAEILAGVGINPRHMPNVATLASTTPIAAAVNMPVMKTGRTSGHTRGQVFDTAADVVVPFADELGNEFDAVFADQILIEGTPTPGGFSTNGDSGSLIVDRVSRRATGLLFAGSSSHTIANHIGDVLTALGVVLLTA